MLESQRRLYTLELFQFASVKADTAEKAPEIPTKVMLKEGKHRKVNFGLGYGSEERARAEVDWRHSTSSAAARIASAVVPLLRPGPRRPAEPDRALLLQPQLLADLLGAVLALGRAGVRARYDAAGG